MFTRSIPAFIDGSLFKAPWVPEDTNRGRSILDVEKGRKTLAGDCESSLATGEENPFKSD